MLRLFMVLSLLLVGATLATPTTLAEPCEENLQSWCHADGQWCMLYENHGSGSICVHGDEAIAR